MSLGILIRAVTAASLSFSFCNPVDAQMAVHQPAREEASRPRQACVTLRTGYEGRSTWSPRTWPGGVVPYAFAPNVTPTQAAAMLEAMEEISRSARVRFVERSGEPNSLFIQDSNQNSSYVGMIGGAQPVNVYNWNYKYIMCHELMHALGLFHEQSRPDRDAYVVINYANISTDCGGSCAYNFDLAPSAAAVGAYDFESVMHYPAYAFSVNGLPTISMRPGYEQYGSVIGQLSMLSEGDISGLRSRYGTCVADVDDGTSTGTRDGGVTIDDLLYYLFLFEQGVLAADVDDGTLTGTQDGGVTIDDLLYFLSSFEAGCTPTFPAPSSLRTDNLWATQVDLRWNDNSSNETQFRVARSTVGPNGPLDNVATTAANDTGVRISGLAPATCYWFKVRAANGAGFSGYSNVLQVCTPDIVPTPPSDLRTDNIFSNAADLRWNDNSNNETQFRIAKSSVGPNGPFDAETTTVANDTGVRVLGLTPATCYWFKVRAANGAGFSEYSNTLQVCTADVVPAAPSTLRIENLWATEVDLRWNDNSNNETQFRIAKSSVGPNGPFDAETTTVANDTGVRVSGLTPATCYWFKVRAANGAGFSEYSNTLQVCTVDVAPTAPSHLRPENIFRTAADLLWNDNSNNETGFLIARSTSGPNGPWQNIGTNAANDNSYRATGLSPGTCYWFKVRATNPIGNSEYTNILPVCTLP